MNIIYCERAMNYGTSKSFRFRRSTNHIEILGDNNTPCYAVGDSNSEKAVVLTVEEQKKLGVDVYFSPIYGYGGWTSDFELQEDERIFIYKKDENGDIISMIPELYSEKFRRHTHN